MTNMGNGSTENRFLSLEYSNLSRIRKFYLYLRSRRWYNKISASCSPSSSDRDMLTSFLEAGIIADNDVAIFKIRNKYYFLVSDDSKLNAMRICA